MENRVSLRFKGSRLQRIGLRVARVAWVAQVRGAPIYGSSRFGRKTSGPSEIGLWPPEFVFQIAGNQVLGDCVSTGFLLLSLGLTVPLVHRKSRTSPTMNRRKFGPPVSPGFDGFSLTGLPELSFWVSLSPSASLSQQSPSLPISDSSSLSVSSRLSTLPVLSLSLSLARWVCSARNRRIEEERRRKQLAVQVVDFSFLFLFFFSTY